MTEVMSPTQALQVYNQKLQSSALYALYKEQQEIDKLAAELKHRQETLQERIKQLESANDGVFSASNTRITRVIDKELVLQNFPDVWNEYAAPSDKNLLALVSEIVGGKDQLCKYVADTLPEKYANCCELSLKDFDAATKDSSAKKKFVDSAYHLQVTPTSSTRISCELVHPMVEAQIQARRLRAAEETEEEEC